MTGATTLKRTDEYEIIKSVRDDGIIVISIRPVSPRYDFTTISAFIMCIQGEYGTTIMVGGFHNIGNLTYKKSLDGAVKQVIEFFEDCHKNPSGFFF